ncbi:MAG: hypothetical protein JST16_02475 [Bdellovibrionales bacterium]|nr:hypothetical protein [Bdellovibrionales bacterium]
MSDLGFELFLRFLWGSCLVLTLISRRETSERFVRIAAWIVAGCAAFAFWLGRSSAVFPQSLVGASLTALVAGSFLYGYGQARFVRTLGFLLYALAPMPIFLHVGARASVNFITSALLFGTIFVGQYLGHWFLNVPGIHIREFQRIVKALMVALALRSVEVIYTLFFVVGIHPRPGIDVMGRPLGIDVNSSAAVAQLASAHSLLSLDGESWFGLGFFGLILLATRLLWGLLAPYLLVYMVKQTVDARSTQSATGILYAFSVMIILGEGTALYLRNSLGWFL